MISVIMPAVGTGYIRNFSSSAVIPGIPVPPFMVFMMVPDEPATYPVCAVTKQTALSSPTPGGSLPVQLDPPSVVFRMAPASPETYPVSSPGKLIDANQLWLPCPYLIQ